LAANARQGKQLRRIGVLLDGRTAVRCPTLCLMLSLRSCRILVGWRPAIWVGPPGNQKKRRIIDLPELGYSLHKRSSRTRAMITKAADIADVIKAFSALWWRSSYAVAPIQIAAKTVPISIRYEFIVSAMAYRHSSIPRTRFRLEHFYECR